MKDFAALLASNVKRLMKELDLNQSRLAEKAGLKHPVINRLVKGKMDNPQLKTVEAIANALGIEAWELLREPVESQPDLEERIRRLEEAAQNQGEKALERARELIARNQQTRPKKGGAG
jgi:transcriptional regulator with XRE-family HTH domain